LIQEKIENYLTKQKVDLAKNTLLLWKKQSNVNVSSDSNLIILDEGASSTSAATPSTSSSTTNNEIFEKKVDILGYFREICQLQKNDLNALHCALEVVE